MVLILLSLSYCYRMISLSISLSSHFTSSITSLFISIMHCPAIPVRIVQARAGPSMRAGPVRVSAHGQREQGTGDGGRETGDGERALKSREGLQSRKIPSRRRRRRRRRAEGAPRRTERLAPRSLLVEIRVYPSLFSVWCPAWRRLLSSASTRRRSLLKGGPPPLRELV